MFLNPLPHRCRKIRLMEGNAYCCHLKKFTLKGSCARCLSVWGPESHTPHPFTQCIRHGRMNYKDTKPYMSAFLSVALLTYFEAFCLTDFIDWRYIHSLVCIFDPACELLPPWNKELYFACELLPLYCTFSLTSFPLPPPLPNVQYKQTVCDCGGGGWRGVWKCTVDHILQEFYTLFLTRFIIYKIASPPLTKWPVKTTLRDWCLYSSFGHGIRVYSTVYLFTQGRGGGESWTRETVSGATVQKAGSTIPTWLTVSPVYKLW